MNFYCGRREKAQTYSKLNFARRRALNVFTETIETKGIVIEKMIELRKRSQGTVGKFFLNWNVSWFFLLTTCLNSQYFEVFESAIKDQKLKLQTNTIKNKSSK